MDPNTQPAINLLNPLYCSPRFNYLLYGHTSVDYNTIIISEIMRSVKNLGVRLDGNNIFCVSCNPFRVDSMKWLTSTLSYHDHFENQFGYGTIVFCILYNI